MQKPTPQSIEALVADVQYHQWPGSTMITCKVVTHNGFEVTADSKPIDATQFSEERGLDEARKKAVAKLWDVAIYEYLTEQAKRKSQPFAVGSAVELKSGSQSIRVLGFLEDEVVGQMLVGVYLNSECELVNICLPVDRFCQAALVATEGAQ